jgi:23S rRNA (uracil1939-C5)-methyltransferase
LRAVAPSKRQTNGKISRLSAVLKSVPPQRAVYVSCNLDALAAELSAILNAGYRIDRIQAVDIFLHTDHIEGRDSEK